jgi:hypothetical protein
MQLILAERPEWTDTLLSAEEALFSTGDNEDHLAIPAGETVIALKAWSFPETRSTVVPAGTCRRDRVPPPVADGTTDTAPRGRFPSFCHSVIPSFTPGAFARAVWWLHTRLPPREAAQRAGEWLKQQHLPFTLRRINQTGAPPEKPDGWCLDLAPAALKKRTVFSLAAMPDGDGSRLDIAFSPKARVRELAARLPPHGGQPHLLCREVVV